MTKDNQDYFITLVLLCSYGLFIQTRPSEPYKTNYLTDPQWKNLTTNSVYDEVFPVWPYSSFALSIPIFLLTDYLKYKPVIILEGVAYIITWSLLIWADGVKWMQVMEFMFGVCTATEVAYYTYIYAKVSPEKYKQVSSYTRSAYLFGRFACGILSQLLISYHILDYGQLNYISLVNISIAFIVSLFLPRVDKSIYFHGRHNSTASEKQQQHPYQGLWTDLKKAYSKKSVVTWSIWVALATCGYYQIGNYIQSLWLEIIPNADSESHLNGSVEAISTLMSALTVFGMSIVTVNWEKWGILVLICVNGISGILLIQMAILSNIWVAYIGYPIFRISYQVVMTIASFEIVKKIPTHAFGLIFGFNSFVALGCQTIMTSIVNTFLGMSPKSQFFVYGMYFLFISIGYISYLVLQKFCCDGKENGKLDLIYLISYKEVNIDSRNSQNSAVQSRLPLCPMHIQ